MINIARNINWGIIILYVLLTCYVDLIDHSNSTHYFVVNAPLMRTLFLVLFTFIHGIHFYSLKKIIAFFIIFFVVGNLIENIGVVNEVYYYTDYLGIKLFHIPLMISFCYFGLGYISWIIAHTLLSNYHFVNRGWDIVFIPLITTVIMIYWDIVVDPLASTIDTKWVWLKPGAYFGVPFGNFLGWFKIVYISSQLFALYLIFDKEKKVSLPFLSKTFWQQPVLMYGAIAFEYPFFIFLKKDFQLIDQMKRCWWASDIFKTSAFMSLLLMGFIVLLSLIRLHKDFKTKQ